MIEIFAIAMASICAGFGSWAAARHRAGKRKRIASPYEAARDRWILTGDQDAYDEMLRLWKGE